MELPRHSDRYPALLLLIFAVIWLTLAWAPVYRQDWLLENLIVLIAVPLLALTYRSLRFSDFAYTCLFAFFVLHEIGAHYTYSEVPWQAWLQHWTGVEYVPSGARNHYDRFVHFAYGLLVFPATWELFGARAQPQRIWRYLMPALFLLSHAVIYELVEWAAATAFGGDLGTAYLGTQGDEWDSQKDMALAGLGTLLALAALPFMPRSRPCVAARPRPPS
jgi:putative membrane protein